MGLEPVLAALVTLIGIALTSAGVFAQAGPAVAPGALLTLIGGGWLGNSLARRDLRLFPGVILSAAKDPTRRRDPSQQDDNSADVVTRS